MMWLVFLLFFLEPEEGGEWHYMDIIFVPTCIKRQNGPFRKWFISSYVVAYVILISK